MTSTSTMTVTSRPTSLSDSGVQLSPDTEKPSENLTSLNSPLSDSNSSMLSDDGKREDSARAKVRMEKYFAEKPDKNIFMKLIHPSYHERNLQFKKIFVEKGLIDESDQFLASYSCAYQREILAQGRMFISQFNVCFYANIIGWETTLVIPMKEIKLIKKMKAAFIFPNSIQIDTSEKYFFASFINRDKSFQVLTTAHQKAISEDGKAMTREEVWDMVYNSEEKNPQNQTPPDESTPASTKNTSTENMTNISSRSFNGSISPRTEASTMKHVNAEKDNTSQSSTSSDFHDEDSAAHFSEQFENEDDVIEEVSCPCTEHFGRLIMDKEFKVSVEKFYELVFTENSFLTELNQRTKVAEYVAATWVRDHQGENTRTCTYNVSVASAMAPKAIIVNEKQVLTQFPNPKHGLMIHKETQNSGVPYADHFTVNCRYCISRTGPSSCRVKVHGGIVYKKNLWGVVKTFIEKGTHNGLDVHYQILKDMFESYIEKHPEVENRSLSPNGKDIAKPSDSSLISSNHLRHRRSQKSSANERLIAGGEHSKIVNDQNFVAEMRPRSIAEISAGERPITITSSSEYKPFLTIIILLLALFFVANLLILQGFQKESTSVVSRNDQNISEMLSALMEQVKELKDKVDKIQKSH